MVAQWVLKSDVDEVALMDGPWAASRAFVTGFCLAGEWADDSVSLKVVNLVERKAACLDAQTAWNLVVVWAAVWADALAASKVVVMEFYSVETMEW